MTEHRGGHLVSTLCSLYSFFPTSHREDVFHLCLQNKVLGVDYLKFIFDQVEKQTNEKTNSIIRG